MRIRTDDDVYRVDAVWLGPPRATFPWRARYASYGVGLLVALAVMFVQRRLGISLGFFSVAWALLLTVAVTRFVGRRINEDRPLLEWLSLFVHELRGPRRRERATASAIEGGHVRFRAAPPEAATADAVGADRADDVPRPRDPDSGFGPPSATTVGAPVSRAARHPGGVRALPPARAAAGSAAADVAAWLPRPATVRVPGERPDRVRGSRRDEREDAGAPPSDRA